MYLQHQQQLQQQLQQQQHLQHQQQQHLMMMQQLPHSSMSPPWMHQQAQPQTAVMAMPYSMYHSHLHYGQQHDQQQQQRRRHGGGKGVSEDPRDTGMGRRRGRRLRQRQRQAARKAANRAVGDSSGIHSAHSGNTPSTGAATAALAPPAKISPFRVDLDALRDGTELRTTVMLRNIPNRFSRETVLDDLLLGSGFQGRFDFLYMPMDLAARSNIGYAFINFTSALAVIDFYNIYHEHAWERTTKTCQVSFGRLQGKEALINQFKKRASEAQIPEKYLPLCFHDGVCESLSVYGFLT
jgi:hypothetical protein